MRIELTAEQRADLQKVIEYAVFTQYGRTVPRGTKGITNIVAMHIEDFYLNDKEKKT